MREALVWNFEDDNFTWMDASVDLVTSLEPLVCMQYQPDIGWQVRWSDLEVGGSQESTWEELQTAGTKWSDLYSGSTEENIYWITKDAVYLSDQVVKTDGIKEYFVERQSIDLNDVVAQFTSDKWIYAKQLYFQLASPRLIGAGANNFAIAVGWGDSLMDAPDYLLATSINLQTVDNTGKVKYDFRSTGRYLALAMAFNTTDEIQMTGAILDAEQTYGR